MRLKGGKGKADQLFSLIIRSSGKCAKCGATTNLQCAHIVSRRYLNLRWDTRNAVTLCAGCHLFYTYHPIEWDNWITERIGQEAYGELKTEALRIRIGAIMYPELIDSLKTLLKQTVDK